ncbi:hypothetical protein D3C80_1525450 [compost metagenome]
MLQWLLGFDGGIDDRFPGRDDIAVDLFQRGLVEVGDAALDEVFPVALVLLGRPGAADRQQVLGEAVFGEQPLEIFVTDEYRASALLAQRLSNADAVQRSAETGFGKQGDDSFSGHDRVSSLVGERRLRPTRLW